MFKRAVSIFFIACILLCNFGALAQSETIIEDFKENYDLSVFDVVDLCGAAFGEQTGVGIIPGTGITILEYSPGLIKFSIIKAIPNGMLWSGIINIVKLRAKAAITTTVSVIKE